MQTEEGKAMFGRNEQGPVEAAKAEILRLAQVEIELFQDRTNKTAQLAEGERTAGDAYLDGAGNEAIAALTQLKTAIEVLERGIDAAHARRAEAITRKFRLEAQEFQRQAREKQGELDELESQSGKLLKKLGELENVPYTSSILLAEPSGAGYWVPRSQVLRTEIQDLEQRAKALDGKEVPRSGLVDIEVTDTRQLIAGTLAEEVVTPSVQEIVAWAQEVEETAQKTTNSPVGNRRRRTRLLWRNGAIDRAQSTMLVFDFGMEDHGTEGKWLNVERGTFRAGNPAR
jgi:hypothetical protein